MTLFSNITTIMSNWKSLLIAFVILILIACLAIPIFFTWYHIPIDATHKYGVPELIYYTTQIIGGIATLAAVIVALYGDTFRSIIYGEKCDVKLIKDGFTENLGDTENTNSPEAQSYDCTLKITNSGNREIVECQVLIKEVRYKANTNAKTRTIRKFDNKPLYWLSPEKRSYDLVRGDYKKIPLYKIYPENSCRTPDDATTSPLRIRVIGCSLENKLTTKSGYWITSYVVKSSEKVLCSFEVEVWWDGTWHNRFSEMRDSISAKIKKI